MPKMVYWSFHICYLVVQVVEVVKTVEIVKL